MPRFLLLSRCEISLDVSPLRAQHDGSADSRLVQKQKEAFGASFLQLITNSLEQERYTDVGVEGE